MKLKPFKIRCSAIGKIMGALKNEITTKQLQSIKDYHARSLKKPLTDIQQADLNRLLTKQKATPELPETAKTYCKDWIKEQLYGKRKDIKSKYLEKGILAEDDAISLVIDVEELDYNEKNEEYFSNEFMTGTPDLIYDNLIVDTKCSYDCFTFPLFISEIDKDYHYQLQGYMELTGARKAMLSYCLIDMPLGMIEKEAYYESRNQGCKITDEKIYNKILEKRTYSNINPRLRVKSFRFDYDNEVIKKIESRVRLCRDYIKKLIGELNDPNILN